MASRRPLLAMESIQSASPKVLRGHQARTTAGVRGTGAIILGSIIAAVGVVILLVSFGLIELSGVAKGVPRFVPGTVGGFFTFVGLWTVGYGLLANRSQRRAKAAALRYPTEPWLADYPWNRKGAEHSSLGRAVKTLITATGMAAFLVPFHWWAFFAEFKSVFMMVFVGLFDLIIALAFGQGVYHLARHLKYGRSYLRFTSFPYFLGERLEARFGKSGSTAGLGELRCTLRFIEERIERTGSGKNKNPRVVCYEHYSEVKELGGPRGGTMRGADVAISFDLPQGDFETRFGAQPCFYWELQIEARTSGVDFMASFLVPIYRNPRAHRDAA